jgi:anti-sigma-K factor RskA
MTLERLTMSCDEVDDLAGAYAVGALPHEELEAVETHLASCRLSTHAELHGLVATAALLPFTVPPAVPPAGLGARILAAAAGETPRALATPPPQMSPPAPLVPFRRRRGGALGFALAAAAMALLALGLGAWGLSQHNALTAVQLRERQQSSVLTLLSSAGTVVQTPATGALTTALLVQPKDGGPAYLLENWPATSPGKIYQAWYIASGKPVSAGLFGGSNSGLQAVQLAGPLQGAQAFAVTIEPEGGSAQPTTQPLFVRPLTTS